MNAASLRAFDNLSAAAGSSLWPATVTIVGISGTIAASVVRPRQSLALGLTADEPESITLTVRISKGILANAPTVHKILTWDAKKWKIMSIRGQESSDAQWSLDCVPHP